MKNINKYFYIFCLFIFMTMVSLAQNVSYRIDSLLIDADVQKNGSIYVNEIVVYDIDYINGILYDIDAKDDGGIKNLVISEADLVKGQNNLKFTPISNSNYEIHEYDGLYKIKIYSKNSNKKKVFLFSYELPWGVKVYNDTAEINRKFVGQNWQENIGNVKVNIHLPIAESYDKNKINAFAHGPLWGELEFEKSNLISYSLQDYSPGEFLEAHILFPKEIVPDDDTVLRINKDAKDEILAKEKELAEQSNLEREQIAEKLKKYQKYNSPLFTFGSILSKCLVAFIIIFTLRRKNRPKLIRDTNTPEYLRDIPQGLSPTEAGNFYNHTHTFRGKYGGSGAVIHIGKPDSNDTLPVILTLIKKKILEVEGEEDNVTITLVNSNFDNLTEEEKEIINLYINVLGDGKQYKYEKGRVSRNIAIKASILMENWSDKVVNKLISKNLFQYSVRKTSTALIFAGAIILAVLELNFFQNFISAAVTVIAAFIIITLVSGASYPTQEYYNEKLKWDAFKRFLGDYTLLSEAKISSLTLWEDYFIYASALNVTKTVARAYKDALKNGIINLENVGNISTIPMFYFTNDRIFNSLSNNTSRGLSDSINLDRISKSKSSNIFGSGSGGFSGGSSFGGGGRSGGGAF